MSEKLRVGILGGTGMVGQRFIALLDNHPWFEVTTIAASPRSAGKTYGECVEGRWKLEVPMPEAVRNIVVKNVRDVEAVASEVDFCFSAVDMSKDEIKAIEEEYAKTETPIVSNNSAHRWTPDVPMIIPEINPEHAGVIEFQKKRLGRFAAELERMISPEGTYPVIGRSISYRFGSFHALADAAWLHLLPPDLSPAQVRCALTAVIDRQLAAKGTFDPEGWLRVGYSGRQVNMGETYINTGSLYLCTTAFLPLGLPADDPFWSAPARDWTSKKAWSGIDVGSDHAL